MHPHLTLVLALHLADRLDQCNQPLRLALLLRNPVIWPGVVQEMVYRHVSRRRRRRGIDGFDGFDRFDRFDTDGGPE